MRAIILVALASLAIACGEGVMPAQAGFGPDHVDLRPTGVESFEPGPAEFVEVESFEVAYSRRRACYDGSSWNSIWVRQDLATKAAIALLYRGETFDVYYSARQGNGALWFYGFAWGGENKWGWVYQYWVTNSVGLCPDGNP